MPIVNFHITGSVDRMQITLTVRDNSNGALLPGTRKYKYPLPPLSSQFHDLDRRWRQKYNNWLKGSATLSPSSPPIEIATNISILEECERLGNESIDEFNRWIDLAHQIQADLINIISRTDYEQDPHNFCFILNADTIDSDLNLILQRLPFHTWNFLQKFYHTPHHAEVLLNTSGGQPLSATNNQRLQVLVIRGYDPTIDLAALNIGIDSQIADVKYWDSGDQNNAGANLFETLNHSSPQVLFFIGHSESTNGKVRIYINDREHVEIDRNFRNILTGLRARGLIFAAFISCDGLGIAQELSDLGIPYLLVSREILPLHVAKEFLAKFLAKATMPGVPIHIALSDARKHLQIIEARKSIDGCPNASNLMVGFCPEQPFYCLNPIPKSDPEIISVRQSSIQEPHNSTRFLSAKNSIFIACMIFGVSLALIWAATQPQKNSNIAIVPQIIQNDRDVSLGDKPLINYQDKDIGFSDFKVGKYESAINKFNKYLSVNKNSPEISIAVNNSIAAKQAKEDNKEPIRIAVGVPLINNIPVAREMLAGVAMYQKKANDNGATLQIVIGRDSNNATSAKKIAQIFVAEPSILAVIGHNASEASIIAAKEVYSPGKLVMLSPTSFDPKLSNVPYIYRMVSQMEYFAAQLQNQIDTSFKDLGIVPQIAICLDPQSPDNQVFKKIFTNLGEALGRQYKQLNCGVFENINATKIKEIVSEIRESRSNALMVSPHINSVGKAMDLLKAIRNEPGLSNIQLFGGPSFYTHVAENNGVGNAGISTDGLTVSVPYFPNPKNIFVKEYAKQWGENLNNWRTPMAYSSTKLVNELLQKKPSRQGLNDLLISTKLFSTQVIDDFYFNTSNELEYIHSSSSKGVLIKLKDQKFTLIKKLD